MGNTINVQGSYIDVHDNQNVYLSVDKAEVKMGQPCADGAENPKELKGEQAEALLTEDAEKYWQRLQKCKFVDEDRRLLAGTTRKQAMYIAEAFAERIGIRSKWKTFERFWCISNLAQEKWDLQQTGSMPSRYKEIDKIFAD